MAKRTFFHDRGLMVEHEDGTKTLSISLDRSRCVAVIYMTGWQHLGVGPTTIVSVENHDPEISLRVHRIDGPDTFDEGVRFALSLILCLELLQDYEHEDLQDELFPGTHVASQEIANARAGLMTVRAHDRATRTG
jgi:hypothetical protein